MKTASILKNIHEQYDHLSKNNKKIASYVLDNYDEVAFMTAKQLSDELAISESTVVRFAKRIGYQGYPDFQAALREGLKNILTTKQKFSDKRLKDDFEKTIQNSFTRDINSIKKTIALMDPNELRSVSKEIMQADNVYIIGLRSSRVLADYLYFYLNFFHEHVFTVHVGPSDLFDQIINMKENDIAILITFPRYSAVMLELAKFLKDLEIPVVALTDSSKSPVCEYAKRCLYAEYSIESFIDSHVAPMALINSLITSLAYENQDLAKKKFSDLEEIWQKYGIYL